MKARGFTTIELLVALTLVLTVSGLVYTAVRPQVRNAGAQVRMANMQLGSRAFFDLFARELRMAGYGADPLMPGMPPAVAIDGQALILNGNFSNVKTVGSGTGTIVTVSSSGGFAVGNYLAIRSFLGGEAARIADIGQNAIYLATPLSRPYPQGSEVYQIERLRYEVVDGSLLRNGQPVLDGIASLTVQYYLADGSLVADPTGRAADVRTALVSVQARSLDQPADAPAEQLAIRAEVRIRNLGLTEVTRES